MPVDASATWRLTWPSRIHFGAGSRSELAAIIPAGARIVSVVSASTARLADELPPVRGAEVDRVVVSGEPTLEGVADLAPRLSAAAPTLVVALGGGSVIDTAKALAAFVPNRDHAPREYLEIVGAGYPLSVDPLPVVALPTTAGTGAEVTHNAVLTVRDARRKVSLRDPRLTPIAAIVDPELGRDVPRRVAVPAGLDAAVQLVEAAVTPFATPVTAMFALSGAELALPALERVRGTADDGDRDALALGTLSSGIALANSKLGTIHGFAGVLGGHTSLTHGALCGLFAAPVTRATVAALRTAEGGGAAGALTALERYAWLARLVRGPRAHAEDLADWFAEVVAAADLPALELTGLSSASIADGVQGASSTRGNAAALEASQLEAILEEVGKGVTVERVTPRPLTRSSADDD